MVMIPLFQSKPVTYYPVQPEILAAQTFNKSAEDGAVETFFAPGASKNKVEVGTYIEELNPALQRVCSCESSYEGTATGTPQQFEKDGKTVRYGRIDKNDRGLCQINLHYHGDEAKELGFDINTQEGNIEMSNYLYKTQGLKPWKWSEKCWK